MPSVGVGRTSFGIQHRIWFFYLIPTYSLKLSLILWSMVASEGLINGVTQHASSQSWHRLFSLRNSFKSFIVIFYHCFLSCNRRKPILCHSCPQPLLAVSCYRPRLHPYFKHASNYSIWILFFAKCNRLYTRLSLRLYQALPQSCEPSIYKTKCVRLRRTVDNTPRSFTLVSPVLSDPI